MFNQTNQIKMKNTIFVFLIFISYSAQCATVNWDGGAGDNLWTSKTNWDTDVVPAFNDDVVISGSSSLVKVTDEVYCKSLTLRFFSELQVLVSGGIEVEASSDVGFFIQPGSVFINDGDILIRNTMGSGLVNSGEIENSGSINVLSVNLSEASQKNGISSSGMLTNFSNGDITISDVRGLWPVTSGINLPLNSILNNFGDIEILNTSSSGIVLDGQIMNSGDILMSSVGGMGIVDRGVLDNSTNGRIVLSDLDQEGISVSIPGIFNNMGIVDIRTSTKTGLYVSDSIVNHGSISLFDGSSHGIQLFGSGSSFMNLGQIDITQFDGHGITNGGNFVNDGHILIQDIIAAGINNVEVFENMDSLILQQTSQNGIRNLDSLINHIDGYIYIFECDETVNLSLGKLLNNGVMRFERCLDDCLINEGEMTNNKLISLTNSSETGIVNTGIFNNNSDATISVADNFNDAAIYNEDGFFGNNGLLHLSNTLIGLKNEALFINEDSILIHMAGLYGLLNADTLNHEDGALFEISGVNDPTSTGLLNVNPDSYLVVRGLMTIANAVRAGITVLEGKVLVEGFGHISTSNIGDLRLQINSGTEVTIEGEFDIGN